MPSHAGQYSRQCSRLGLAGTIWSPSNTAEKKRSTKGEKKKKLKPRGLSVADIVTGLFSEFLQQGDHHEALNVNVLIRVNLFISATDYLS